MFRSPTNDLIVVLVIVLVIFGPKRLPALGRSLGQGLREFKDSITGDSKDSDEAERPSLQASSATPVASAPEPEAVRGSEPPHESAEVGSERRS
jgi:sec-independent protein translocase protein TatA